MSTAELMLHQYKADKHKALFENLACDCWLLKSVPILQITNHYSKLSPVSHYMSN